MSFEELDTGEKVIITCTNNGDKTAQYVIGTVLYFSGYHLVGYVSDIFTDDDYELQPGVSITKEFDFYGKEGYDRFEVYYSGRRFIDGF